METHVHSGSLTGRVSRCIFDLSVQNGVNLWEKFRLGRKTGLSGRSYVLSGQGFIGALRRRDSMLTLRRPDSLPIHQHDGDTSIEAEKRYKEPDFFKGQPELRALQSDPSLRKKLQEALAKKEFGCEQLVEIYRIINADNSDLFDVLDPVAFALPTESREVCAARARRNPNGHFGPNQKLFPDFVLSYYVRDCVDELDIVAQPLSTYLQ